MSRDVVFVGEGYDAEDGGTPQQMMRALEASLLPLLEEEKARIEAEVAFLKEVHSGITRGAPLEASSSISVDVFLSNLMEKL